MSGGHSNVSTEIRELVSFLILPALALLITYLVCIGLSKRRLWHTSSEVVAATYTKWIGIVAFIVHALLPSVAIAGGGTAAWRLFTRYNAVSFAKAKCDAPLPPNFPLCLLFDTCICCRPLVSFDVSTTGCDVVGSSWLTAAVFLFRREAAACARVSQVGMMMCKACWAAVAEGLFGSMSGILSQAKEHVLSPQRPSVDPQLKVTKIRRTPRLRCK